MTPEVHNGPENCNTAKAAIESVVKMADENADFSRREQKIFNKAIEKLEQENPATAKKLDVCFKTDAALGDLKASISTSLAFKENGKLRVADNQTSFYQTVLDELVGLPDNSLEDTTANEENSEVLNAEWTIEKYQTASRTDIVKRARSNPEEIKKYFLTQNGNEYTWDFKGIQNAYIAVGNWAIPEIMENDYIMCNGDLYSRNVSDNNIRPGFFNGERYLAVDTGTTFRTYAAADDLPQEPELEIKIDKLDPPLEYTVYQEKAAEKLNVYENMVEQLSSNKRELSKEMQKQATAMANKLGVNPAIILALTEKESHGNLSPTPRFEQAEYDEQIAKGVPEEKARMLATSYGAFQIMGYNYESAGYQSVEEFVTAMENATYETQLESIEGYIRTRGNGKLLKAMQATPPNFAVIAELYNGPNYAENNYDKDIKQFYQGYKRNFQKNNAEAWEYFDPIDQIQPEILAIKEQYSNKGKQVAAIAELVASRKNILGRDCWDWARIVYEAAGATAHRTFNSKKYSKRNNDPEYASDSQVQNLKPGDWFFLHNGNSWDDNGNGDHSGIFLGWEGHSSNQIARVASGPGAEKPGRISTYNLKQNPVTRIKTAV